MDPKCSVLTNPIDEFERIVLLRPSRETTPANQCHYRLLLSKPVVKDYVSNVDQSCAKIVEIRIQNRWDRTCTEGGDCIDVEF